jgi:hypothetical protein
VSCRAARERPVPTEWSAAATVCLWPADWTCSLGYYAAGDGCDCGCGIPDPDCADASVTACEYCDDPGSCSASACPGTIDPDDNTACA